MKHIISSSVRIVVRIITLILLGDIILKLFAANTTAFVAWLYGLSDFLLMPFEGIFANIVLSGQHIFDTSALLGLIVYLVVGKLLISVINAF